MVPLCLRAWIDHVKGDPPHASAPFALPGLSMALSVMAARDDMKGDRPALMFAARLFARTSPMCDTDREDLQLQDLQVAFDYERPCVDDQHEVRRFPLVCSPCSLLLFVSLPAPPPSPFAPSSVLDVFS